jgi:ADP-heptose:LPS heptosyltransferase
MLVKIKVNYLPNIHIVDRYLDTLKPLGIYNDDKGLDFFIEDKTEINLPQSHQNNYVAFVIGGAHATKKMTTEKLISICKKITKPIVLIGGKEDLKVAEEIIKSCGNNLYNACGIFTLQQSALALKNAESVITHDTGMMHIAAAFNKKIISVWGNTVPEFGMYPYLVGVDKTEKNIVVEVKHLKCRPCSKIGYDSCPKQHFNCMNLINENDIINNVN